ncbi:SIS domain-containing protein [Lactobacillus sp. YT155]|uniref:SIS domain-containing protein n=1 Tax=Lactobacillus sp. YT155 TaxID=3060955 RepID=UPI00265DD991|nr:SIS domain-containing protein [Lactobacillus sp. YT155]MDO1605626.1 SIS domain-containing protein [Lactobacillus sp. YT155]
MTLMKKFDVEKYLESGKKTYAQRKNIEELADKLSKKDFDNIIMIGIGGTWMEWYPVAMYLRHLADFPVYLENAAEFVIREDLDYLSEKSLVLTASASGDTKEILDAVKFVNAKGIDVYGFTKDDTTPLDKLLKEDIYNPMGDCEDSYLMYFMLALRIYKNWGYFNDYDRWADQMKNLHSNLLRFREEFEPRGTEIAKKYYNAPLTMIVGSGMTWGETSLFSMCILEEMQWVRTRPVTSAEFFHGAIELVDDTLPVFLVLGEDEYRPMDERVERFAKEHTNKFEAFDTKDFVFEGIDDDFRRICSPMIVTAILTDRLATLYSLNTGHDLDFRRYYRQFAY